MSVPWPSTIATANGLTTVAGVTLGDTVGDMPRISAVINTLNEEQRLPYALRSLAPWVDEIVVVDMESDDNTVAVARSFGAKVFSHPRLGYADPARAFAVAQATGDWMIVLDADEVVPPTLASRLREIAQRDEADVVVIHWANYLLGRLMRGDGWGITQDYHPRFFKPSALELTPTIHDFMHPRPGARLIRLNAVETEAIIHFNYADASQFIQKLDRYTSIEAQSLRPRASIRAGVRAASREFWTRYIRQRGYRDGWQGFYLAFAMAFYRLTVHAKRIELASLGGGSQIESSYRDLAERVLEAYEGPDASVGSSGHPSGPSGELTE